MVSAFELIVSSPLCLIPFREPERCCVLNLRMKDLECFNHVESSVACAVSIV